MKTAILCIVALLQLQSLASGATDTCACEWLIAGEIEKLNTNLTDALKSMQQGGMSCCSCMQEPACPSSLGLSSYRPAKSCREILQCNPSAQSGNYWLNSTVSGSREVYCAMETLCGVAGGWMRTMYFDMTDSSASCPTTLRQINTPAKLCGRTGAGCAGITYPTEGVRYSQACGQARGYQYYSPDAFGHSPNNINSHYVDGVAITYGSPRQHLWTYAGGLSDNGTYVGGALNCPCTTPPGKAPPDFVGEHYYCESGITGRWEDNNRIALEDPLWDGVGCGPGNSCCNRTGLPWFYRTLPQESDGDIEVRLCASEASANEDVFLELLEIYVQ